MQKTAKTIHNRGTPRVSVVMPVYNREEYIQTATESILNQTFQDLELIVVDDASTDETRSILTDYARRDRRIRVIHNKTNIGPAAAANRGFDLAVGEFIAPMDSDDISDPRRLEHEVGFLDANPSHILVTSSYRVVRHDGSVKYVKKMPADDFAVRWLSRFRMALVHAASCFRSTFPDGTAVRYDPEFGIGHDFELFTRLMAAGKVAVLREVLFSYRMHPSNISSTRQYEQRSKYLKISVDQQEKQLPQKLFCIVTDLLRCYRLGEKATTEIVYDSVVAMNRILAHDVQTNPNAERWLRRQAAEILADAILRYGGGFSNPRVMAAFLIHARHYLWPLLWRVLENKGYLPRRLESFPDPAG